MAGCLFLQRKANYAGSGMIGRGTCLAPLTTQTACGRWRPPWTAPPGKCAPACRQGRARRGCSAQRMGMPPGIWMRSQAVAQHGTQGAARSCVAQGARILSCCLQSCSTQHGRNTIALSCPCRLAPRTHARDEGHGHAARLHERRLKHLLGLAAAGWSVGRAEIKVSCRVAC